jgi:hypothetical protein
VVSKIWGKRERERERGGFTEEKKPLRGFLRRRKMHLEGVVVMRTEGGGGGGELCSNFCARIFFEKFLRRCKYAFQTARDCRRRQEEGGRRGWGGSAAKG